MPLLSLDGLRGKTVTATWRLGRKEAGRKPWETLRGDLGLWDTEDNDYLAANTKRKQNKRLFERCDSFL